RQGGGGGSNDRPGHALRRFAVGLTPAGAFRQPAVGVFGHHNAAVDQHADRQNQGKQHHHVHGVAAGVQHNQRHQKSTGNNQPNQYRSTQSETTQHQHHHQQRGDQHVIEQVVEHFLNLA